LASASRILIFDSTPAMAMAAATREFRLSTFRRVGV
jgi:hypothetical protein